MAVQIPYSKTTRCSKKLYGNYRNEYKVKNLIYGHYILRGLENHVEYYSKL